MSIAFACPGCAKTYEVSDTLAGKTGRCKACGQPFKIPVPRTLRTQPPAPEPLSADDLDVDPPLRAPTPTPAPARPSPRSEPARPAPPVYDDLPAYDMLADEPEVDPSTHFDDPPVSPLSTRGAGPARRKKAAFDPTSFAGLPMLILGGGGTALLAFLGLVVWPSMQDSEAAPGGNAAPADALANAPPAAAPVVAAGAPAVVAAPVVAAGAPAVDPAAVTALAAMPGGPPPRFGGPPQQGDARPGFGGPPPGFSGPPPGFGGPPPGFGGPPAGAAAPQVRNGFPVLPPVPSEILPKAQQPALRDVSQHEGIFRELIGLLNQFVDVMAGVREPGAAQAAVERIQAIQDQIKATQDRSRGLPNLSPAENAEVARRVASDMKAVIARMRQEADRIAGTPGMGASSARFRMGTNLLAQGFEQMLALANTGGPQPYVEVYVKNVPDGDTLGLFAEKLRTWADSTPGGIQSVQSGNEKSASIRLWPVADAAAFARKIDFGTATATGTTINVTARPPDADALAAFRARKTAPATAAAGGGGRPAAPDPEAPAGADESTRALFLLKSSNGFRQREGLQKLARMVPSAEHLEEVVDAIEPLATGTDHFNAIEGLKALGTWKGDRAVKLMGHVIESSDDVFIRREAMKQLARIGDPAGPALIVGRLKDDWPDSVEALKQFGPKAESAVVPLLRHADSRTRSLACEVLQEIGGKETWDTMRKLPPDSDFGVKIAAGKAMEAIAARLKAEGVPLTTPRGAAGKGR